MTGRLLTARIVAQRLGLCTETVLAWVRRDDDDALPAYRLPGGAIRIPEDELDVWLEERATSKTRKASPITSDAARTHRLSSTVSPITDNEEA